MSSIWKCAEYEIDTGTPQIMGIVNVTTDSFSDGGAYIDTQTAITHAGELIAQGATILDIGGESTRPGSSAVSPEVETARVVPVVEGLAGCGVPISVDTRNAETARAVIAAGAHIINDISGFTDPEMIDAVAGSKVGLVVMHMKGEPKSMQTDPVYDDVIREVCTFLEQRSTELQRHGIDRGRICFDPGFGFGKNYEHNLLLLGDMDRIVNLGYPVLVGVSRKKFIARLSGIAEPALRDIPSAQIALDLIYHGASIVRVHNVEETKTAIERESKPVSAYIALGTNIGDRLKNLRNAVGHLRRIPHANITNASQALESEPAYKTDQQSFGNAVVKLETSLGMFALFAEIQYIEQKMSRVKLEENGPRIIDLDLLLYGDTIYKTPELEVPHAGIAERAFVTEPLLEIEPNLILPDGRVVARAKAERGRVRGVIGEITPKMGAASTEQGMSLM
ncbi:MAG: dihydropteroate synthase [Coriobacteriia bacterium]|nr:dihydropteroate synthase [Coriobacteriia bacterium]